MLKRHGDASDINLFPQFYRWTSIALLNRKRREISHWNSNEVAPSVYSSMYTGDKLKVTISQQNTQSEYKLPISERQNDKLVLKHWSNCTLFASKQKTNLTWNCLNICSYDSYFICFKWLRINWDNIRIMEEDKLMMTFKCFICIFIEQI